MIEDGEVEDWHDADDDDGCTEQSKLVPFGILLRLPLLSLTPPLHRRQPFPSAVMYSLLLYTLCASFVIHVGSRRRALEERRSHGSAVSPSHKPMSCEAHAANRTCLVPAQNPFPSLRCENLAPCPLPVFSPCRILPCAAMLFAAP